MALFARLGSGLGAFCGRHPAVVFVAAGAAGAAALFARRTFRTVVVPQQVWESLCTGIGVGDKLTSTWWEKIDAHYAEPQRFYHRMSHVQHMLDLQHKHAAIITKPATLQLATFFHDVIYNPESGTNEEDSAELFKQFHKEVVEENGVGFSPIGDEVSTCHCCTALCSGVTLLPRVPVTGGEP